MKQKRRWLLINEGYLFLCLFVLLCFFLPIGNYQCQPSHAFGRWRREKIEGEKCPFPSLFFFSPTSLQRSLPNTDILKRVMANAVSYYTCSPEPKTNRSVCISSQNGRVSLSFNKVTFDSIRCSHSLVLLLKVILPFEPILILY